MISALIPWKADPNREQLRPWVLDRIRPFVDEIIIGEIRGEWCKARAVEIALEDSKGDVLVIFDADLFYEDPKWLTDCLGSLYEVDWCSPHNIVHRLDDSYSTHQVMTGENPWKYPRKSHRARAGGGVTVLPRKVYEDCPMDPRFRGWGQEDDSWALALETLHGPGVQHDRPVWHLWHQPQRRINRRIGNLASFALFEHYEAAHGSPSEMRALIEEVR